MRVDATTFTTMRILIKGGVWKNTEDEILKAAVMKYGKNQWARVASLLNRKSAKQCKARWYEWLDPSIKKTEWSRDEEEKLLHLAKLMPNQWRTIAPIVGRTAGQCMEHYEKLLDMVQEKITGGDDADDPRRLRAGEIDPAPETKPARPDPVDMDEDEKEMLSEARARLANTKGKKAKRKARERQLEESRRLSMLQKRRELKAAGIESRLGGMGYSKRKFIDYAREIPFQKVPPSGFYDVSGENMKLKSMKLDAVALGAETQKLEGRHLKEEEEKEREKDRKRLKTLFKANAPLAIKLIEEQNDPTTLRKRMALNLPAPQVDDSELEQIAKFGQTMMAPPEGTLSTQTLVGDYAAAMRPTPTPLRTPLQEDIIMQEARNLRVLREMTPLLGKDLPELQEGTGFSGATPRLAKLATPNSLMATPMTQSSLSTPHRTPMVAGRTQQIRDTFGLNEIDEAFSMGEFASVSSKAEKLREKQMKAQLAAQLKGLPEPEFTYDISIPAKAEEEAVSSKVEDAADVEARRLREEEDLARLAAARRSAVLQRGLPRPFTIHPTPSYHISNDPELQMASALVNEEAERLINSENRQFPDVTLPRTQASEIATLLPDELIQSAREMIMTEMEQIEGSRYSYILFLVEIICRERRVLRCEVGREFC